MAFVLGLGFVLSQFLYPSVPSSAGSYSSGVRIGANIQEFIRMALDTSLLTLADSQGNTVIAPASSGTEITGNVNVAVTTNTAQGYALNLYTSDNTTDMVNSDTATSAVIASVDTASGYDATTGISALANNTWGFRRNSGTMDSPSYSNWYAIGENESNGTVIVNTNTGSANHCKTLSYPLDQSGCNPNTYDTHIINFGAKVTPELASGTYTNNVVFSAVAKSDGEKYTLLFNSNGGTGQMGPRVVVNGSTVTLPSKGFIKDGLGIKGWALTQADAEIATNNNINGTTNPTTNPIYTAGQTVEVTSLLLAALDAGQAVEQDEAASLYAIWGNQFSINFTNNNSTAISSITPTSTQNYTINSSVSATCTPNAGYHCTEWVSSNTSLLPSKTGNTKTGDFSYYFKMPAGDITLTANAAANTFTINYDANSGSGTTNPTTATYGTNVNLRANSFTAPEGKKFKEWNTSSDGNGTTYASGQTGIAPATLKSDIATVNGGSITLYAIWEDDILYMQTWNGCSSLATNSIITLTDKRDGNEYHIKKLADGKCWMVENLRLINKTITSSDSNVSADFTVPTSTPAGSSWCTSNSQACDDQPLAYYDASTRSSYGALYNWYTATAGTGKYNTSSGTVSSSICPKGWRLPTGGASGGFVALDKAWGGTGTNRDNANTYSTFTGNYNTGNNGGFDLAGYISGSSLYSVGTYGYWWSSTANNNSYAYSLYLYSDSTSINPQNDFRKYNGYSVRCIASS